MTTKSPLADLQAQVLVVDDHAAARESTADILRDAGLQVACCASASEALRLLGARSFDLIITDLKMPGMSGLEFIRTLHQRKVDSQIIMVTAYASVSSAVDAMRHGAFDYLEKPFTADQLEDLVARALRHGAIVDERSRVPDPTDDVVMIGNSPPMQRLREQIIQAGPTNETVLIMGESGVGKELVARSIHANSQRARSALVSLNCPALSPQLMESELFGHERGAFTSADAPRVGRFELAHQGTIFLDEVTEISLPLQAKLLRVLQERCFERVGSSETRQVNVRILASTNRDLQAVVTSGQFREDLYFRLAVIPMVVPPLRQRRDDVPALAAHFLRLAANRLGKDPSTLGDCALQLLFDYCWPGNIRELENIMTRASVLLRQPVIRADDIRPWLIAGERAPVTAEASFAGLSLRDMERKLIEATLDRFDGHRAQTAAALGIGIRTLTNKLREYGYAPRTRQFARAA